MSGPAVVTDDEVHITGAGTVTIRASQAGNGDFEPAYKCRKNICYASSRKQLVFDTIADKTVRRY